MLFFTTYENTVSYLPQSLLVNNFLLKFSFELQNLVFQNKYLM